MKAAQRNAKASPDFPAKRSQTSTLLQQAAE